jgi:hypothetical protein
MSAALGGQFWQHAAGATALRVLLAAAGLDSYLESRIEVQFYVLHENVSMQSDISVSNDRRDACTSCDWPCIWNMHAAHTRAVAQLQSPSAFLRTPPALQV